MSHAHDLRAEVSDDADNESADRFVDSLARDWRSVELESADRALCEFASKLTLNQQQMSPNDLEPLRREGFDDRAIHDAAQIIGYFNYITRIADSLGVEPEDFVHRWGQ